MFLVVMFDLSNASVDSFDSYENAVLGILPQYGGRLTFAARTRSNSKEIHLIHFPDDAAYASFLSDTLRESMANQFKNSRATIIFREIVDLLPPR